MGEKPNIDRILMNFMVHNFKVQDDNDSVLLTVTMPTLRGLKDLKRRLGGKKERPTTRVRIIEMSEHG